MLGTFNGKSPWSSWKVQTKNAILSILWFGGFRKGSKKNASSIRMRNDENMTSTYFFGSNLKNNKSPDKTHPSRVFLVVVEPNHLKLSTNLHHFRGDIWKHIWNQAPRVIPWHGSGKQISINCFCFRRGVLHKTIIDTSGLRNNKFVACFFCLSKLQLRTYKAGPYDRSYNKLSYNPYKWPKTNGFHWGYSISRYL